MTMPERHLIARYWLSPEGRARIPGEVNSFVCDLGEPSCFACGWYLESAPCYPDVPIPRAWDEARLERAHLVPRALGGLEAPDNLVLICQVCHQNAPNVRDAEVMLGWMVRRPSRSPWVQLSQKADAVAAELRALDVDLERDLLPMAGPQMRPEPMVRFAGKLFRYLEGDATTHWGEPHYNAATIAWALAQALREATGPDAA